MHAFCRTESQPQVYHVLQHIALLQVARGDVCKQGEFLSRFCVLVLLLYGMRIAFFSVAAFCRSFWNQKYTQVKHYLK